MASGRLLLEGINPSAKGRIVNENARKWVKALRSGRYRQTTHRLHAQYDGPPQYCCLGVACRLYSRETGDKDVWPAGNSYLPAKVREWLGLRTDRGGLRATKKIGGKKARSLAGLNDEGVTFKEIAALIEAEPEGLFK